MKKRIVFFRFLIVFLVHSSFLTFHRVPQNKKQKKGSRRSDTRNKTKKKEEQKIRDRPRQMSGASTVTSVLAGDWLQDHNLCRVCALPLPASAPTGICSKRCTGRKKVSADVHVRHQEFEDLIIRNVSEADSKTGMCSAELSAKVLPEIKENPLNVLRPLIFRLAEQGRVALLQKGSTVSWMMLRGPFRIKFRR